MVQLPEGEGLETVSTIEFEQIISDDITIDRLKEAFPKETDSAFLAGFLTEDYLFNPEASDKTKIKIFKELLDVVAADKITESKEENVNIFRNMINAVRFQTKPEMKIRLGGMLNRELSVNEKGDGNYVDYENDNEVKRFRKFQSAVYETLKNPETSNSQKSWIKYLSKSKNTPMAVLAKLFDENKDIETMPNIEEMDVVEPPIFIPNPNDEKIIQVVPEHMVILAEGSLPSYEKSAEYRSITGRDLPIFGVRDMEQFRKIRGEGDGVAIVLPQVDEETARLVYFYQNHIGDRNILRRQIYENIGQDCARLVSQMNDEQRAKWNGDIIIRFTTQKDEYLRILSKRQKKQKVGKPETIDIFEEIDNLLPKRLNLIKKYIDKNNLKEAKNLFNSMRKQNILNAIDHGAIDPYSPEAIPLGEMVYLSKDKDLLTKYNQIKSKLFPETK